MSDDSYNAMLNNPFINPGPAPTPSSRQPNPPTLLFPALAQLQQKLQPIIDHHQLHSESDEPFEFVNFESFEPPVQVWSVQRLFRHQPEILEILEKVGQTFDVYVMGQVEMEVYVLCKVVDPDSDQVAFAGLKSVLVQS